MKKFKRILSLVLVVALCLGVLVACCGASADGDENAKAKQQCEEIVKKYTDAVIEGKYTEAAKCFNNVDTTGLKDIAGGRSAVIYQKLKVVFSNVNGADKLLENIADLWVKETKCEIISFEDGDSDGTYKVKYKLVYPDWEKVEKEFESVDTSAAEDLAEKQRIELNALEATFIKSAVRILSDQVYVVTLQEVEENGKTEIKIIKEVKEKA